MPVKIWHLSQTSRFPLQFVLRGNPGGWPGLPQMTMRPYTAGRDYPHIHAITQCRCQINIVTNVLSQYIAQWHSHMTTSYMVTLALCSTYCPARRLNPKSTFLVVFFLTRLYWSVPVFLINAGETGRVSKTLECLSNAICSVLIWHLPMRCVGHIKLYFQNVLLSERVAGVSLWTVLPWKSKTFFKPKSRPVFAVQKVLHFR